MAYKKRSNIFPALSAKRGEYAPTASSSGAKLKKYLVLIKGSLETMSIIKKYIIVTVIVLVVAVIVRLLRDN